MVKGGSATHPGVPYSRVVELEHRGIEHDRERSPADQLCLHHPLVLDPNTAVWESNFWEIF